VLDINALPDDVHRLKRLLLEHHAASLAKDLKLEEKNREIEHLKWQLAKLRRARLGQSSERFEGIGQLPLTFEELAAAIEQAQRELDWIKVLAPWNRKDQDRTLLDLRSRWSAVGINGSAGGVVSILAELAGQVSATTSGQLQRQATGRCVFWLRAAICAECARPAGACRGNLVYGPRAMQVLRCAYNTEITLGSRTARCRYTQDGRLSTDNNIAERSVRGVGIGRKNYMILGSDNGGDRAAILYSLIETCKFNRIDPQRYLHYVLKRIADHPINRVHELLPWNVAT